MVKWYGNLADNIAGVPHLNDAPPWNCSNPPPEAQLENLGSMYNSYGNLPFPGTFKDYEKDSKLAELIEGKTVAFVGPSAHLIGTGLGEYIESHDIVVRVNQTVEIPSHRWDDYGSRTDVLASNLNGPSVSALQNNIGWVRSLKHIFCAGPSMWDRDKFGTIANSWGVPWHNVCDGYLFKAYKEIGTTSSTGLSAMIVLMNYDVEHLYITGNSFYNFGKCGVVYYTEFDTPEMMSKVNGQDTYAYRHDIHAIEPQLNFFDRMLQVHYPHKLKVDGLLEQYFIKREAK